MSLSRPLAHVSLYALTGVLLAACASEPTPSNSVSASGGESPAESSAGTYKVGQPYQIGGEWYYPKEDYSYDETGIASWYGKEFHGQRTANGEMFNKNELTAAHKTLPLPTLARVTNLDNGRSIVVRINDRGPFSGSRIIDLSQRAAQLLGFDNVGTAKVRVQVLADESKAIADAMRHYGRGQDSAPVAVAPPPVQVAEIEHDVSSHPVVRPSETAPVESETLAPIRTNPEVHRELLKTHPVAEVVELPVTGENHIYVQAGAFTVAENADHLKDSLSQYGTASISNTDVNGRTFYRVRLGPVPDVAHADALLSKLKGAGISGARTVIDQ